VLALDLTLPAERKALTSRMEAYGDRLVLAVNNAGFGLIGPTWTGAWERVAGMIELNITALTEISYSAARIMSRKRSGGIINVASTVAFQAVPYMNAYSATKAYVLSFTEGLAEELVSHGVRVMALCPGPTESEFQAVAGVRPEAMRTRIAMTAEECVRLGLQDFERGKRISITGWGNKLLVFGTWLAPRNLVTKAARRMMQSRLTIDD
jgi:short-subunit dehydrogenase